MKRMINSARHHALKKRIREIPGSPVIRTPCAHCQSPSPCPSSIPGWGTKIPQDMWQKKKKKKKERKRERKKRKRKKKWQNTLRQDFKDILRSFGLYSSIFQTVANIMVQTICLYTIFTILVQSTFGLFEREYQE